MIIDTDIIIRYITGDDKTKAEKFEKFLQTGKKGKVTDVGFAEIYWTLKSFYRFKKSKILPALEALLNTTNIESNKRLLTETTTILRNYNISFIDAYHAANAAQNDGQILSYDTHFDRLGFIQRLEP